MNEQTKNVISIAEKYLGTKESPRGSNNVMFNTAYYGRAVSGAGYEWCCVFVWYVFREAGLSELFYGGEKTASCTTLMNYAKSHGQFIKTGFKPGDLALFNWNGSVSVAQHIGVITETLGDVVMTIEGNTGAASDSNGGEVMARMRNVSNIIGAYRPAYKEDEMDIDALKRELTGLSGTGDEHSAWADDAVMKLTNADVFNGDGDGNYGWGQLVTREALAQVLYNLIKLTGIGEMKLGD